ncbi:Gfo/Idh/MocA family oxidoreductase [Nakamurella flavida]|uniref:Gfo/Idh/MocA family oxidoreductase n=1 Tax=Nakamurella flavida TaxID=363630 RepID=A0A938YNS4_9ACTN|nr:Gfo/Idh/MocA family oxidoreductase [Nakamurella flavida]MBM9476614.1 Gfo/Idh/MocA family oxidoreductase [Nakamurella flavida]MDP9778948.1 putative dehydrogenase [Nakamurella flavida]
MSTASTNPTTPLGIGVLGAARISTDALIDPAHEIGARLVAVAARDRSRATEFASRHGVEHVVDDYQAVIDHPDVEVIYNPLTNNLHAPWNLRAIRAGKPVLTEKPSAADAVEARTVRDAVRAAGVPVIEAFHHLHHPLMHRMAELALGGELGDLQYVEVRMMMPPPPAGDLRWDPALAGGGLMDVGCYAVRTTRELAHRLGGEPELTGARGGELTEIPGVDAWIAADLRLPGGVPVHLESSMTHHSVDFSLRVVGSRGEAFAPNYVKPQEDDRIVITRGGGQQEERMGTRSSYAYQLEAFTDLVRNGTPMSTDADDAVLTMTLIDDIYRSAGMAPRTATPDAAGAGA